MSETTVDDMDMPVDEALLRGDGDEQEAGETTEVEEGEAVEQESAQEESDQEATEAEPERKDEFIPKARFNEVLNERTALREELERLRSSQSKTEAETVAIDIKAIRKEATAALLDGDTDRYDELQGQIDNEILRQAEANAETRMAQRSEYDNFQSVAAKLTEAYPVLNPETGDPEAIALVVELRDAYISKGMNMTKALETAANKIAPRFTTPSSSDDKQQSADVRQLTAVKRGAVDSAKIPPSGVGVGNRAQPPRKDAEPSQSEWEGMTAAQRQKYLESAA